MNAFVKLLFCSQSESHLFHCVFDSFQFLGLPSELKKAFSLVGLHFSLYFLCLADVLVQNKSRKFFISFKFEKIEKICRLNVIFALGLSQITQQTLNNFEQQTSSIFRYSGTFNQFFLSVSVFSHFEICSDLICFCPSQPIMNIFLIYFIFKWIWLFFK